MNVSTITAAVMGLVNAALQLLIAFGVTISDSQNVAITAFVNALLVIVALVLDKKTTLTTPTPPPAGG